MISFMKRTLNRVKKHVSFEGQIVIRTCENGSFKYHKFQEIEKEAEDYTDDWLSKNSSRRLGAVESWRSDAGMRRGLRVVMLRMHSRTSPSMNLSPSLLPPPRLLLVCFSWPEMVKGSSKETNGRKRQQRKSKKRSEKSANEANDSSTRENIRSVRRMMKRRFVVLQRNTRSLNSSERSKTAGGILFSFPRHGGQTQLRCGHRGHAYMGAGKFENKHGVATLLNKEWRKINWTEYINERAIATSITVNKQRITSMSVYFLHWGFADHHVERAYNSIEKIAKSKKICTLWKETSMLNLVPVLELNASVLVRIPSKNQTAQVIG